MSQLQEIIQKQYTPQEAAVIEHAHELAVKAHEGQMRESGEPYIIHPENVALILAQMGMDAETVCAALLHDVGKPACADGQGHFYGQVGGQRS